MFRYYLSGAFVPGAVNVTFLPGSFSSNSTTNPTGYDNLAKTDHFTVQQLTADLADPQSGALVGVTMVNGRSFVDVTFTVPSGAELLDVSSATDAGTSSRLPRQRRDRTIALDETKTLVLHLAQRLELRVPVLRPGR